MKLKNFIRVLSNFKEAFQQVLIKDLKQKDETKSPSNGTYAIKHFMAVINSVTQKSSVFVTCNPFLSRLKFIGKAGCQPEWSSCYSIVFPWLNKSFQQALIMEWK